MGIHRPRLLSGPRLFHWSFGCAPPRRALRICTCSPPQVGPPSASRATLTPLEGQSARRTAPTPHEGRRAPRAQVGLRASAPRRVPRALAPSSRAVHATTRPRVCIKTPRARSCAPPRRALRICTCSPPKTDCAPRLPCPAPRRVLHALAPQVGLRSPLAVPVSTALMRFSPCDASRSQRVGGAVSSSRRCCDRWTCSGCRY